MQKDYLTILQLSDLHLFKNCRDKFLKVNPYDHLSKIVEQLLSNKGRIYPDMVVITGDLSQDYSFESYALAKKILSKLAVPLYATMGNHDDLTIFQSNFGVAETVISLPQMPEWEIILLNTHVPSEVYGRLSLQAFELLKAQAQKKKYQIIFMHHPLFTVDSIWLDQSKIVNSAQFFNLLENYWLKENQQTYLKGVFAGHVHQETYFNYQKVAFFTAPAVGWQFAVLKDNFSLDEKMPGYRWIKLYCDGNFKSICERLDYSKKFLPDNTVASY